MKISGKNILVTFGCDTMAFQKPYRPPGETPTERRQRRREALMRLFLADMNAPPPGLVALPRVRLGR